MSSTPSFVSRVLPASIFLFISVTCFYLMDIISLIIDFPSPTASGFLEWDSGKIPILNSFHWIRPVDPVIREITPGFAPSSFGYDNVSRWQMINFLISDPGVFYVIWGCESLRKGIKGGPVHYPGLFAIIAQFGGGGVIIPIYYFAYMVSTAPNRSRPLSERRIDIHGATIWSILVVLFHVIPGFGIMFDATFEDRHWWAWFWQLYSVRITVSWYAIRILGKLIPFPTLHSTMSYLSKVTLVLAPFLAIAIAFWTYTVLYCPYTLSTVFYPHALTLDTWVSRMRRILQFDQLFIFGSSVIWVAMDMRRNDLSSGIEILVLGVILAGFVGTGASFGLLWLCREWKLVSNSEETSSKVE